MRAKRERADARDHQKTERLSFIDEELFWAGEVTRRSIEDNFGVSEETAKADLRDYRRGYASDLNLQGPVGRESDRVADALDFNCSDTASLR